MKKKFLFIFALMLIIAATILPVAVYADTPSDTANETAVVNQVDLENSLLGNKAIACGIAISFAAGLGALGMGIAVGKSAEGIARQPEAEGKIRTTLMLGIVFMETAIIYALLVVILIIFVL